MTNESTAPTAPSTARPPATAPTTSIIERCVDLDLDVTAALDAVLRPEILSVWLGRWTPGDDDTHASVVTDDGIRRRVTDIERRGDGVSWRWRADTTDTTDTSDGHDAQVTSDVRITIVPVDGGRSRLTVTEVQASTGAVLDGLAWSICLLALEIAAAARALALV